MKRILRPAVLVACALGVVGGTVAPPATAGPNGIPFRCKVYAVSEDYVLKDGRAYECYY